MILADNNLSIYYFSEEDVKEVLQLAESSQQRLCHVSETGETEYYFLIPEINHFAEVKVSVSATRSPQGRHVSYEVFASYQGCCTVTQDPSIDEHFRRQIQLVYNIRIQVVRLRFDAACCEKQPHSDDDSLSCQEKEHRTRERLKRLTENHSEFFHDDAPVMSDTTSARRLFNRSTKVDKRRRLHVQNISQGQSDHVTAVDQCDDRPSKKVAKRNSESHHESHHEPHHEIAHELVKRANHLVRRAKNGLEKVRQKSDKTGEHHSKIEAILSRSKENSKDDHGDKTLPSNGASLNSLLQELEAAFDKRRSGEQGAAKARVWHSWYYSACLRIVLYHRGQWHNDRRVKGVKLLHQIVNKIAAGYGPKALMLILAYAEEGHYLTEAARGSQMQQDIIGNLVVKGLIPTLQVQEVHSPVPFPAAWISNATGISYREVCTILHVPNFSVFWEGHQPKLTESLCYSTAEKLWSAFVQKESQLRKDIEACPPPNWEQLQEVIKFSWVVNRYCDSIESTQNLPEGHAQPAPDNESSSHTPSENRVHSAPENRAHPTPDDETHMSHVEGSVYSLTSTNADEASERRASPANDDNTSACNMDDGTSPRSEAETGSGWDMLDWTQDLDMPFDFMRFIDGQP